MKVKTVMSKRGPKMFSFAEKRLKADDENSSQTAKKRGRKVEKM